MIVISIVCLVILDFGSVCCFWTRNPYVAKMGESFSLQLVAVTDGSYVNIYIICRNAMRLFLSNSVHRHSNMYFMCVHICSVISLTSLDFKSPYFFVHPNLLFYLHCHIPWIHNFLHVKYCLLFSTLWGYNKYRYYFCPFKEFIPLFVNVPSSEVHKWQVLTTFIH